jgi:hypothetical protein
VEGASNRRVAREAWRIKDVHAVALLVVGHTAAVHLIFAPARLPAPSRTMLLRLPATRRRHELLEREPVPGRVAVPHKRREQKQIAQLERREQPPSFVAS